MSLESMGLGPHPGAKSTGEAELLVSLEAFVETDSQGRVGDAEG